MEQAKEIYWFICSSNVLGLGVAPVEVLPLLTKKLMYRFQLIEENY